MIAFIALSSSIALAKQDVTFEVESVNETKVFAGKLGNRIMTELHVVQGGRHAVVTVADIRHDRFGGKAPYSQGDRLVITALRNRDEAVVSNFDIHRAN